MLSRSIHTYAAPSDPLAGTVRFHCSAAYTPCLRCALPPRRPTTGSVLSLRILSQHVALCDSGESGGCVHPVPSPPTLAFVPLVQTRHSHPSRKSVSRGGPFRSFTTVRLRYNLLICSPPDGSNRIYTQPARIFTTGLSTGWSPAPSPVIATVATG